jgi:hypothetical protein
MREVAIGLTLLLVFLAGGAASYAHFVPPLRDEVAAQTSAQEQLELDSRAKFKEQEKSNDKATEEVRNWYKSIIASLKHNADGVQRPVPTQGDLQGCTSPNLPQGADGAIGQPGLATIFYKGKSVADRMTSCEEDVAKLSACQLWVLREQIPIK